LPRPVSAWDQAAGGARALKARDGDDDATYERSVRNRSVLRIGTRDAEGAEDASALPARLMPAQRAQNSAAGEAGFAGSTLGASTPAALPNVTIGPLSDPGSNRWKWLGKTMN
jgi:hypothetical protein